MKAGWTEEWRSGGAEERVRQRLQTQKDATDALLTCSIYHQQQQQQPQMNISHQHMNIASVTSACKHTKAECSNPLSGSY